jgi:transposase
MRPKGNAKELERRRFRAVELLDQGEPANVVARILGVSQAALSRWRRRAREGTLRARPVPGRPRRLSDADCRGLEELLQKGAVEQGWPNNLWTAGRVARLIETHFGVSYHPGHVSRILTERLNWTCQRPTHQHRDRNDAAIEAWVREAFPRIVAATAARRAHLVFVDEAGFMLEPTVRRTYAPQGQTPVHRIGNPHARISVIGAIILSPARDTIDLRYAMLPNNLNFRGPQVIQFLRALRRELDGPMTILWDRIAIHECEDVDGYLAGAPEVVTEPLPAHAPELNAADGIWRYIKFGRLANYSPSDLGVLRKKVLEELARLKGRPDLLKSFVEFTKLPIDLRRVR